MQLAGMGMPVLCTVRDMKPDSLQIAEIGLC